MTRGELSVITKTVSVLDSVDYGHYSQGTASSYPEYASGEWTDERILIAPILFPRFLEQVLGFALGETIGTQEAGPDYADIPDYIPADTRTHPFVFDCKGMDTTHLGARYAQIRRYAVTQGLQYGILTNMRDFEVYTANSSQPIEGLSFSILRLYEDFARDPRACLEQGNTQRFLRAVDAFAYTPLTLTQKLERVCKGKRWTGSETLQVDLLTRRLRSVVQRISEDARSRRQVLYSVADSDPDRARDIAQEVQMIAAEIDPGMGVEKATLERFHEILSLSGATTVGRALQLYFQRVGYFTMTRLLLARAWEDIGFIDQTLYDGGLANWYENFNEEIRWVLKHAFDLAADRYRWLFNEDNNYTWYEPSSDTLIEVLYELSNFYLGNLDQDILGTIYEEYIDRVDKRRKGQYYTPREIVEFIWDRVGLVGDEHLFRYVEGRRVPRLIFDPASGSGGFLVEAARRLRENSGLDYDDFQDVLDLRTAILTGIFGSEISVFAYYISEVNLLIQLTPVIKRMVGMRRGVTSKGTPALGVLPVDALSLYNPEQPLLEKEQYDFDPATNLLPLGRQKQLIFRKIKADLDGQFSYCCANPPYVGEKGNKELFRATLERFPYWRRFYQGRMDYLYFFIILALSKLEEGGKLGFITTAYWPTADGASKLRKYILKNAKITEMTFFEDVKIFEYAKGQHNMIFVLEKCSGEEREQQRGENRIKVVRILAKHQAIPGDTIRARLRFLTNHIQGHICRDAWEDEYIRVFWSGVRQGELSDSRWGILSSESEEEALVKIGNGGEPLRNLCFAGEGVKTSANVLTKALRANLADPNLRIGTGIFVLTEEELMENDIPRNIAHIKPFFGGEDVCPYAIERKETRYLIYADTSFSITDCQSIRRHLERFRPALERRAEVDSGKYKWYSLPRPREKSTFENEKLVASYRSDHNRFAYCDQQLYGPTGIYFVTKKAGVGESLEYILGLLNSQLLDFWMDHRSRKKGAAREYTSSTLYSIPIRRIDFNDPEDVRLHDQVVEKVRAIRERMAELGGYSRYYGGLRLARVAFQDPLPAPGAEAIVQSLPPHSRFSLRTHPGIEIAYGRSVHEDDFVLDKVGQVALTLQGPELTVHSSRGQALFISGEEQLLNTVAEILSGHPAQPWSSVKELPVLPQDVRRFQEKRNTIAERVSCLALQVRQLQRSIDSIVLVLYGVEKPGE
jgi:hypothetical protein